MVTCSAQEKKKKVKKVKTAEEVLLLFVDICGSLGACYFVIQFSSCSAMFCLQKTTAKFAVVGC